jgi:hypothetical protein
MKTKPEISIRSLAEKTGADRASIAKWIHGITDPKEALATVREHQKTAKAGARDPKTGLTWFQAKLREDALRMRRENAQAAGIEAETWMATADHHKIIAVIIGRLDQIPNKAHSELGITPEQTIALQRMIDEARTVAAKEIEEMEGTEV